MMDSTTDNPAPQPLGVAGAPDPKLLPEDMTNAELNAAIDYHHKQEARYSNERAKMWRFRLNMPSGPEDVDIRMESERQARRATQPATAPNDLAHHVRRVLLYCSNYGDSVCICNDDQPIGVHDDECDDARRLWERVADATPTDVAERARRAVYALGPMIELADLSDSEIQRAVDIITAEFQD
jgi:hypothetical protein